jgi:hypothetical protein
MGLMRRDWENRTRVGCIKLCGFVRNGRSGSEVKMQALGLGFLYSCS